jgi:hypothetical protein
VESCKKQVQNIELRLLDDISITKKRWCDAKHTVYLGFCWKNDNRFLVPAAGSFSTFTFFRGVD